LYIDMSLFTIVPFVAVYSNEGTPTYTNFVHMDLSKTRHIVHYYFARSLHKAMYVVFILLPLSGLIIAALYTKGYQSKDELLMEAALGLHSFAAQARVFGLPWFQS